MTCSKEFGEQGVKTFVCPSDLPSGYFADSSDCTQYYLCSYGNATPLKCDGGLLFNPVTGNCDFDYNVHCVVGPTPVAPVSCQGLLEGTYIPDPDHCQYFYRCMYGEPRRGRCQDGLLWSDVYIYCDYAINVDCSGRGSGTTPTSISTATAPPMSSATSVTSVISCLDKMDGGYYPDPTNCYGYYYCSNGVPYPQTCVGGQHFNPVTVSCDDDVNVLCIIGTTPVPPVSCDGLPDGTYLTDPYDCHLYYRCMYGEARHGRCPDDLVWNDVSMACDHVINVDCSGRGHQTVTGSTSGVTSSDYPSPTPTTPGFLCPSSVSSGYYADPGNCSHYFLCTYGIATAMQCGGDLLFNPITANCDQADNVYCVLGATAVAPVSCQGLLEGTYLPDPDHCQYFYRCMYGEPRRGRCQDGLLWSDVYIYCDYAINVDCSGRGSGTTPTSSLTPTAPPMSSATSVTSVYSCLDKMDGGYYPDTTNCYGYYYCSNGVPYPQTCVGGQHFNPVTVSCDDAVNVLCVIGTTLVPPVSCDGLPDGTYLTDPYDCHLYYRCMYGEARHGRCPDDLVWNDVSMACDHVINVDCSARGNLTVTGSTSGVTSSDYPSPTPTAQAYSCVDKMDGGYYPDPTNCYGYFYCSNGVPYPQTCVGGQHFNPVTVSCDDDVNVLCIIGTTPVPPVLCDGLPDGTYLTDPYDCHLYYRCMYGEARHGRCPDDLVWNDVSMACDHMINVDCSGRGHQTVTGSTSGVTSNDYPSPTPPAQAYSCVDKMDGGYYPDPTNCYGYYYCSNGVPYPQTCVGGQHFNPVTVSCDDAVNVLCVIGTTLVPPVSCDGLPDGTYLTDPYDCHLYYRCMYGEARHGRCPDDLVWNDVSMACDHVINVDCSGRGHQTVTGSTSGVTSSDYPSPTPTVQAYSCVDKMDGGYYPDPTNCYGYYYCSNGVPYPQTCVGGQHFNPVTVSCDDAVNVLCVIGTTLVPPVSCDGLPDGTYLTDPYDCHLYYRCMYGEARHGRCPDDLVWNDVSMACDHVINVDCSGRGHQTVTGSTSGVTSSDYPSPTPTVQAYSCVDKMDGGYYPDPTNCYGYYYCSNGVPYPQTCVGGQHFNPVTVSCDDAVNVLCVIGTTLVPPVSCDGLPDGTYLTDPYDCHLYYRCMYGEARHGRCPDDLVWNDVSMACDHVINVDCSGRGHQTVTGSTSGVTSSDYPSPTPTVQAYSCVDKVDGGYYPDPTNCYGYYYCSNGVPYPQTCVGGQHFNPVTVSCDDAVNVLCVIGTTLVPPVSCDGLPDGTYLTDPYDCHLYYRCMYGEARHGRCPDDLVWNDVSMACDHVINVDCSGRGHQTVTGSTSGVTSSDYPSPTPTVQAYSCVDKMDGGYYPDPTNCYGYYYCSNGVPYPQTCVGGQHFNPVTVSCDDAVNVLCVIGTTLGKCKVVKFWLFVF
ncbi:uncharacterized protein LOC106011594 [Aplysia californica]|uniref:Uncharacterized protein LOC106011594 n=1 Tax=Aplysia californica TaxID=6500 RepID=A0ABM0ZYL0_APLCA|nr:uncharacterized protein LOC106011594 [Aplysia californica]